MLGTLHYGAQWPGHTHTGADQVLPRSGNIADFHTDALEWEPGRIRCLLDGVVSQTQAFCWSRRTSRSSATDSTRAGDVELWPAPFDRPFYLRMNLAVGGNFLGNPEASTAIRAEMLVDYVRIFERSGRVARVLPRGAGTVPPAQR